MRAWAIWPDTHASTVRPVHHDTRWVDYLEAALSKARMRPSELARKAGVSDSVLSRWRRGESVPDVPNLRRLSRALEVPLLELMVAAGHIEPAEARMRDRPATPSAAPVGAGVDPDVLADLVAADPATLDAVKAVLRATKRR